MGSTGFTLYSPTDGERSCPSERPEASLRARMALAGGKIGWSFAAAVTNRTAPPPAATDSATRRPIAEIIRIRICNVILLLSVDTVAARAATFAAETRHIFRYHGYIAIVSIITQPRCRRRLR
jgi:hypothetical protein